MPISGSSLVAVILMRVSWFRRTCVDLRSVHLHVAHAAGPAGLADRPCLGGRCQAAGLVDRPCLGGRQRLVLAADGSRGLPHVPAFPPRGPGRGFRGSRGVEPHLVLLWLRQHFAFTRAAGGSGYPFPGATARDRWERRPPSSVGTWARLPPHCLRGSLGKA